MRELLPLAVTLRDLSGRGYLRNPKGAGQGRAGAKISMLTTHVLPFDHTLSGVVGTRPRWTRPEPPRSGPVGESAVVA